MLQAVFCSQNQELAQSPEIHLLWFNRQMPLCLQGVLSYKGAVFIAPKER